AARLSAIIGPFTSKTNCLSGGQGPSFTRFLPSIKGKFGLASTEGFTTLRLVSPTLKGEVL
ncbi:MAG TPA: hypothetical protein VMZ26_03655, partial [Pyrinomonadaceae bacterium]|nr:hypothetical protein [Pyrinomonadaceae bacterium]